MLYLENRLGYDGQPIILFWKTHSQVCRLWLFIKINWRLTMDLHVFYSRKSSIVGDKRSPLSLRLIPRSSYIVDDFPPNVPYGLNSKYSKRLFKWSGTHKCPLSNIDHFQKHFLFRIVLVFWKQFMINTGLRSYDLGYVIWHNRRTQASLCVYAFDQTIFYFVALVYHKFRQRFSQFSRLIFSSHHICRGLK